MVTHRSCLSILAPLLLVACASPDSGPLRRRPSAPQPPTADVGVVAGDADSLPEWASDSNDPSEPPGDCLQRDVRILEVHYDPIGPDGAGEAEYIEIDGPPGVSTAGLEIRLINGSNGSLIRRVTVLDGHFTAGPWVLGGAETPASQSLAGALQNGPDSAELWDLCLSRLVDRAEWPLAEQPVAAGQSIQRCSDGTWASGHPSPGRSTAEQVCVLAEPDSEQTNEDHDAGAVELLDAGDWGDSGTLDDASHASADIGAVDGDVSDSASHSPLDGDGATGALCPDPAPRMRLSEILFDPSGADSAAIEFVEVETDAAAGEAVEFELAHVDGGRLTTIWTRRWRLAAPMDGLLVVGATSDEALSLPPSGLQNGPDRIELRDCHGRLVDAWDYGPWNPSGPDFVGDAAQGSSLSACPDSRSVTPRTAAVTAARPTPGRTNTGFLDPGVCGVSCEPGNPARVHLAAVLFNPDGTDAGHEYVVVRGSPGARMDGLMLRMVDGATATASWSRALSGRLSEPDGTFIVAGTDVVPRDSELPGALQNGPDWLVLEDCGGELLDSIAWGGGSMSPPGTTAQARSGCALLRLASSDPWTPCCTPRLEPFGCVSP